MTKNPTFDEEKSLVPEINLRPTLIILGCGVLGSIMGVSLSDGRGDEDLISWIKLPGDLFINALKCVVLPLVFVNLTLASIDMYQAGKTGSVASKTIGLYALTTLSASATGLIFLLMFKNSFSVESSSIERLPEIEIICPEKAASGDSLYVTQAPDGSLICSPQTSVFLLNNSNGFLVENEPENGLRGDISFSETVQDGIFKKLISENITADFVNENFASIIVLAMLFGVSSQTLKSMPKVFIELLAEVNRVLLKIIDWIIFLTPIAVFSLIAGNLGEQEDIEDVFKNLGVFTACVLLALAFHSCVFYPSLYFFFTRENPFSYLKFILPAQIFVFAAASSAAALPITMDCVAATKKVPTSIANFVLSMGATLNMDGGAIYFPAAVTFIAIAEGREDELDASRFLLMILLATIGSAGTAPIPAAGDVLIVTAYNTVFDLTGTPRTFELLLAIDWFIDRFRGVVNITGDAVIARVIAKITNANEEDDVFLNEAQEGEKRVQSLR